MGYKRFCRCDIPYKHMSRFVIPLIASGATVCMFWLNLARRDSMFGLRCHSHEPSWNPHSCKRVATPTTTCSKSVWCRPSDPREFRPWDSSCVNVRTCVSTSVVYRRSDSRKTVPVRRRVFLLPLSSGDRVLRPSVCLWNLKRQTEIAFRTGKRSAGFCCLFAR